MAWPRPASGAVEGAALLVSVTGLEGEEAVLLQIQTKKSSNAYLVPVSADGLLEGPFEASPILPDGLCFFDV